MPFPKGANSTGTKAKRPHAGIPLDKQVIIDTIRKYNGNLSRAAEAMGTSRHVLRDRADKDEDINKTLTDSRERYLDTLEDSVWERAIDSNDSTIQIFLLKTAGRKRGYDQDQQNGVQDIAKAAFEFVLNKSKNPAEYVVDKTIQQ